MAYVDSYLWRLRQSVGNELVLMPGAMVVLQRDDGQVLLTRRADDGSWCLPAGAAVVGGSFAQTAIDELAEETGIASRFAFSRKSGTGIHARIARSRLP